MPVRKLTQYTGSLTSSAGQTLATWVGTEEDYEKILEANTDPVDMTDPDYDKNFKSTLYYIYSE